MTVAPREGGKLTAYLVSMKGSLTATISISGCSTALRKTIRPMRPKPLMPTLMGAILLVLGRWFLVGGGNVSGSNGRRRASWPSSGGGVAGAQTVL